MRTRKQKIEALRHLATQPAAYLTQAHCDLLNEYSKGETHKPGPLDGRYIASLFFTDKSIRDEFSRRWTALPELPEDAVLITVYVQTKSNEFMNPN